MSDEMKDRFRSFLKVHDLWSDFKNEILHNNRYFLDHEILVNIRNLAEKRRIVVQEGEILYRARVYKENCDHLDYLELTENERLPDNLDYDNDLKLDRYYLENQDYFKRKDSGFWGYSLEESFIPPVNTVGNGRVNPELIRYLYTAKDPNTAIAEFRPYIKEKVSIAKIQVNSELKIADFTNSNRDTISREEKDLLFLLDSEFSKPNKNSSKLYIATQFISEYLKYLKYDGIQFRSSLDQNGINVTIFNYEKCEPISSEIYCINRVEYKIDKFAPK